MSVNFSSASNSSNFLLSRCSNSKVNNDITLAIAAVRTILTLPLSIFVHYLDLQQWRQQRSFQTTSHSYIFTYHMAVMDLIWAFRYFCYYSGVQVNLPEVILLGVGTFTIAYYGNIFFYVLTCAEHYLAVVHLVTYLGLRQSGGVQDQKRQHRVCLAAVLWTVGYDHGVPV
ncbi:hypothetical protein L3Q82_003766 [Scortum barcoo]|uniref:Uncharacterized protein n=1 Tax=Scortum barcoo TaxID=214431 RepID=A0ACB8XAD6_9TELE|nr:hypothetical protein L3Q82_003766 [Scortum barcoo]